MKVSITDVDLLHHSKDFDAIFILYDTWSLFDYQKQNNFDFIDIYVSHHLNFVKAATYSVFSLLLILFYFKGSTQWQNNAFLHPRTHCL